MFRERDTHTIYKHVHLCDSFLQKEMSAQFS